MSCSPIDMLWVVLPPVILTAILDRLAGAWWSARVQRQQDRHCQESEAGTGVVCQPCADRKPTADNGSCHAE